MTANRSPQHGHEHVPSVVVAVLGTVALLVLPIAAAAVVAGVTVAVSAGAWALARGIETTVDPATVAMRAAATSLVVLAGPVIAAATLGPRSVPLLAGVFLLLAALVPVGHAPRNVDR